MISVGIPSWNGKHHLEILLPSLIHQQEPGEEWEVLIHENGSTDGTTDWLAAHYPSIRVLTSTRNLGFALACNELVQAARGELVVLVNNDTHLPAEWLGELVAMARSSPPDVVAVTGKMVSWDETRLDFGGGIMTFDGHAFQEQQGLPLQLCNSKPDGAELPFACGGNMIVNREVFQAVGGFEPNFYAYFEDVDLGWRLWSAGYQVRYSERAWIRHKGGATTVTQGVFNRGFLFERNALLTVMRNYDEEFWPRFLPAVLLTFQSRVQEMLRSRNPGSDLLLEDPYIHPSGFWESVRKTGLKSSLRRVLLKIVGLADKGVLSDPLAISQLRAQASFLQLLDQTMKQREKIQSLRRVADRDIFERFPLYLVPTYPGDSELFRSPGFQACLPDTIPLRKRTLEQIGNPHA